MTERDNFWRDSDLWAIERGMLLIQSRIDKLQVERLRLLELRSKIIDFTPARVTYTARLTDEIARINQQLTELVNQLRIIQSLVHKILVLIPFPPDEKKDHN